MGEMQVRKLQELDTTQDFVSLSRDEKRVITDRLAGKRYNSLGPKQRRIADALLENNIIKNFIGILHPDYLEFLGLNTFLVFIDAEQTNAYRVVKQVLTSPQYKKRYSSCCTIGEKDFFFVYIGTDKTLETVLTDIVNTVRTYSGKDISNLINCYRVTDLIRLNRVTVPKLQSRPELDFDTLYKLNTDYRLVPKTTRDMLTEQHAIIGYAINYNFQKLAKLRMIILVWYPPGSTVECFSDPNISKHTLDVYKVSDDLIKKYHNGDYKGVSFIVSVEFDKLSQYAKWMDRFYDLSPSNANCFTLPIESAISLVPSIPVDFQDFDDVCTQYTGQIKLGSPIFLERTWEDIQVGIDITDFKYHGLIIARPDMGKSTTALVIAKAVSALGVSSHLLDVKNEFHDRLKDTGKVHIVDLSELIASQVPKFNLPDGRFYIYELKNFSDDESRKVISILLDAAPKSPESDMTDVLFIDEAHKFFTSANESLVELLSGTMKLVRSKGKSIFLISQELSELEQSRPGKGMSILDQPEIRIFHQLFGNANEIRIGARLLGDESLATVLDKTEKHTAYVKSKGKKAIHIKVKKS